MSDVTLPPLYDRWARQALSTPLPVERQSTCSDCLLRRPEVPEARRFAADSKCCTYVPRLPNFLVGQVLADPDPAMAPGREAIRARLRAGVGVHPLGLELRGEETAAYEALVTSGAFGQGDLRCPYYITDGGLCGIWRHRNGICSTWFCRHERGGQGVRLWKAVEQWLSGVESVVQRWAARRVRFGPSHDVARADHAIDHGNWGEWISDIEGFYRACAEQVGMLDWPAIQRIDPEALDPLHARLAEARHAHDDPVSRGPLNYRGYVRLETGPTGQTWLVSPAHRFTLEAVPEGLDDLLATYTRGGFEAIRFLLKQAGADEPAELAERLIDGEVFEVG